MEYMLKHFSDLRDVSETIDSYLQQEIYNETYEVQDNITPHNLLFECYLFLIAELKEYGILLIDSEEDIAQDFYTAHKLIEVKRFIMVDSLMRYCRTDEVLDQLDTALNSDEEDGSLLEQLFAIVSEVYQDDTIRTVEQILPQLYSTEALKKYLLEFLKMMRDNEFTIIPPDSIYTTDYLNKTKETIKRISAIVDYVITNLPDISFNMNKVQRLVDTYDGDKISATDIHIYAALDRDVPSSLEHTKAKALNRHHFRSPHHIEYWTVSPTPPTSEDILLIMVTCKDDRDMEEFLERTNIVLSHIEIFDNEQISLIERMKQILSTYIANPAEDKENE